MARPIKDGCDYFSHDADMRNHRKVKAVRMKFGISGYAIFNMTLEYLTSRPGNKIEDCDIEYELLGGDFGVSSQEIKEVIEYCITLGMMQKIDNFIQNSSLNERLAMVYEKREKAKNLINNRRNKQNTEKVVVSGNNPASCVVVSPNNPTTGELLPPTSTQSKVKYSKVKKNTINTVIPEVCEIIGYLNEKTGKNFSPETKHTEKLISARIKQFTVEDAKRVIDHKVQEWINDVKMRNYLTPDTLFAEKNFEKYVNSLPVKEKKMEKGRGYFWSEEEYRQYCLKNNIEYKSEVA